MKFAEAIRKLESLETKENSDYIKGLADYFYYQTDCDLNDKKGLLKAASGIFNESRLNEFADRAIELALLLEKEDNNQKIN